MQRVRAANAALVVSATATMSVLLLGDRLPAGALVAALLLGYSGCGLYLAAARRTPGLRAWPVLAVSGLLLLGSMVRPPLESNDVWSYASYGRMVAHYHESPWAHVPAEHPRDAYAHLVVRFWSHTPSVYGPAFAPPAAIVMALAGSNSTAARVGFQLLAALSVAAALWLIGRETGWSPGALAVVGINPLIIVGVVNGAHNDAWCAALLLGAVILVRRRRWAVAGLLVALAAMIKVTAMLAVVGLVLWAWRRAGRAAAMRLGGTAAAVSGALLLAAGGSTVVHAMTTNSWRITGFSAWALVRDRAPQAAITTVAVALVAAFAGFLVLRHRTASHPSVLVGLCFVAYLVLGAYVWPWYAVWGLLPLALCWRAPTTRLVFTVGMLLELAGVPFIVRFRHDSTFWHVPLRGAELLAKYLPYGFVALAAALLFWAVTRWRSDGSGGSVDTSPSSSGRSVPVLASLVTRPGAERSVRVDQRSGRLPQA